jgi:hypothetical protein
VLARSFAAAGGQGASQEYGRSVPLTSRPFDVNSLLEREATSIVDNATSALDRSQLSHYQQVGDDERRRRVQSLFEVVLVSLQQRDLVPIHHYAESVAGERFEAGVGIAEVQTAFNVLEEAIWQAVVLGTEPATLAESIGLVATVLGAGKDSLARTYVALATARHVPSLDLTALFQGPG